MNRMRKFLAYIGVHTCGLNLIYPGACWYMPRLLGLRDMKSELMANFECSEFNIKTEDKNKINGIFIDQRGTCDKGDTLVICCEGSASFYEDGCLIKVPLEAGYSTVGWNHPGFGNSTGKPFPSQEQNAIDAVVQYAIHNLKFRIIDILFYSWSIGGYVASWAAMKYQHCKGIILDAPFDNILDLAKNVMPNWLNSTVDEAINNYVNLNVSDQLKKYSGPILIIRRVRDECVVLEEGNLSTNRANYLLTSLLMHRFPYIFQGNQLHELEKFLAVSEKEQEKIIKRYSVDEEKCKDILNNYISRSFIIYPLQLGQDLGDREKTKMALFLVKKYLMDFDSKHCTPLPSNLFEEPWNIENNNNLKNNV